MWKMIFNDDTEMYDVKWVAHGESRQDAGPRYSEVESHSSPKSARRAVFIREAYELGMNSNRRTTPMATAADETYGRDTGVGIGYAAQLDEMPLADTF